MRVTTIFFNGDDYQILNDEELDNGGRWDIEVSDGVLICFARYRDKIMGSDRYDKRFFFAPGSWRKVRIDDA